MDNNNLFLKKKCVSAETVFHFLGIGSGKKEETREQFMNTFEKNSTASVHQRISNVEMIFSDESFLFSNLIFAVLMLILARVFGESCCCPSSRVQFFMTGDPFQLLVFDKSKLLGKCKNAFMDVFPFETNAQIFSKFFESLMATGLRVVIVSKVHRASDISFLETCHQVLFFIFLFYIIYFKYIYIYIIIYI